MDTSQTCGRLSLPPELGRLALPLEIRQQIWQDCAANGAWVDLIQCNKTIKKEVEPYCQFPGKTAILERLTLTVDSKYIRGRYLDVQCEWTTPGPTEKSLHQHKLGFPLQSLANCAFSRRLLDISTVKHINVRLVGPSHGHFFGAFLMMFAKFDDVKTLINRWTKEEPPPSVLIAYFTEADLLEQNQHNPATPFWECRYDKEFLDEMRRFAFKERGLPPYAYEYFLPSPDVDSLIPDAARPPVDFGLGMIPSLELDLDTLPDTPFWNSASLWGRAPPCVTRVDPTKCAKIQLPASLLATCSSFSNIPWLALRARSGSMTIGGRHDKEWSTRIQSRPASIFAKFISRGGLAYSERSPQQKSDGIMYTIAEMMACDKLNLELHLSKYLDHHTGPPGGPLDMLRLHRFKTIQPRLGSLFDEEPEVYDFFRRDQNRWVSRKRTTAVAQIEVAYQCMHLFNPLASEFIVEMRNACKHLRAINWPAPMPTDDDYASPRLWVDSYLNGVSYRRQRAGDQQDQGKMEKKEGDEESRDEQQCEGSIVQWRNAWRDQKIPEHIDWPYYRGFVVRTWECGACCVPSIKAWKRVACAWPCKRFAYRGGTEWKDLRGDVADQPFDVEPDKQFLEVDIDESKDKKVKDEHGSEASDLVVYDRRNIVLMRHCSCQYMPRKANESFIDEYNRWLCFRDRYDDRSEESSGDDSPGWPPKEFNPIY